MNLKLSLNFEKQSINQGVLDTLSNGLQEDLERDVTLISLKECLAKLANGYKLPYKAANYLLTSILCTLAPEDGDTSEEMVSLDSPGTQIEDATQGGSNDATLDPPPESSGTGNNYAQTNTVANSNTKSAPSSKNKKVDICRFYARGHCTRKNECRFQHPTVCKKFRQSGSKCSDPKGCDGKCDAFHPNACRSSLLNRTCSYRECRFYHLKGTKTVITNQSNNSNAKSGSSSSKDWRSNQQTGKQGNTNQQNKPNQSKNRSAGLENKSYSQHPNQGPPNRREQEIEQEKNQLSQTLEAIMKRLTAMETRQGTYQTLVPHHVQPLLSPAVPQPGTQTQLQWASPHQWTQSQSQPHY